MDTKECLPARDGDRADPPLPSVRVDETFLLLDPVTGGNLPVADEVLAALPAWARARAAVDPHRCTVQVATLTCFTLADLRTQAAALRSAVADAATVAGAQLVAIGATPVGDPLPGDPATAGRNPAVALDAAGCAGHLRVGVPDRETAVQVCNHLRVWLPVVQALTANSPLSVGSDTGHASWRAVQLAARPGAGPTPVFASAAEYDRTVAVLVAAGVAPDPTTVRWYARPSDGYPGVELRVGDVCPTVDDTVLVAGLVRALVGTLVQDVRAGMATPRVPDCLVSAAHWRAARDGLEGSLIDLRLGRERPAWELVDELFATVSPALLRHGDLHLVVAELARLRRQGSGAARQRRMHRRTGDIRTVLATLAEQTVSH